MNVYQLYTIINSMVEQTTGQKDLQPTHAQFISNGETILNSTNKANLDTFYNVLLDRVGRTVLAMRAYARESDDLHRDPLEWGAIFQKLSMDIMPAKRNNTWNPLSQAHTDPFAKTNMTVIQKLFSDIGAWDIDYTVPDVQLQTAFLNEQAMVAFLEGLTMSAQNSMELAEENNALICRGAFMQRKAGLSENYPSGYRNLLAEYNAEYSATLTVTQALNNEQFLRFCAAEIATVSDNMVKMSKSFNDGSVTRHTPKDLQILKVLAKFEKKMESQMQYGAFHDQFVKLNNYTTVPYWQGSGKNWDWNSISTINFDLTTAQDDPAVSNPISNIIAVLYDRDAIGTTMYNHRSRSIYNPADEYTNYFLKADIGYYNDMSENGIVFYLGEEPAPEPEPDPDTPQTIKNEEVA